MKSKPYVKFLNRSKHLVADMELIDVLAINSSMGKLSKKGPGYLFNFVNADQHPTLAARKNSPHNRRLAIRHLKASFCAAFIKELYEDFSLYIQEILFLAAKNGLKPGQLIGDHNFNIDANTLLGIGGWDEVVRWVSNDLFRKLENERSTKKLLEKIIAKLGLKNLENTIESALPYLDVRHKLVHADGIADDVFKKSHPSVKILENDKIFLDFEVAQKAKLTISAMILEIDRSIIANGLLSKADLQK